MFMSISRPSARGRYKWVASLVATQVFLAPMAAALDNRVEYGKLNPSAIKALLSSAVAKDESIPDDVSVRTKIAGSPIRASSEADGPVLIPFTVDYKKLANSYCRLAVLDQKTTTVMVLPVPTTANYANCSGYRTVLYEDINGDRVKDFIAEISIKSNRYDVIISETVVYISSSVTDGGFCYSTYASKAIAPSDLHAIRRNPLAAIEKLRKILVKCSP
ncbi:hypothetical protein BH11PSE12_BH11PSE12_29570 [soil metagenome]